MAINDGSSRVSSKPSATYCVFPTETFTYIHDNMFDHKNARVLLKFGSFCYPLLKCRGCQCSVLIFKIKDLRTYIFEPVHEIMVLIT